MTIGQKIQSARKGRGLTQPELADKIEINYKTLSDYERGKSIPSGITLDKIAKVLDYPVAMLMEDPKIEEQIVSFHVEDEENDTNLMIDIEKINIDKEKMIVAAKYGEILANIMHSSDDLKMIDAYMRLDEEHKQMARSLIITLSEKNNQG